MVLAEEEVLVVLGDLLKQVAEVELVVGTGMAVVLAEIESLYYMIGYLMGLLFLQITLVHL